MEKCPSHVDGGAAYCCDEKGESKKCKCASSAFTIYASTTPIKTIIPPKISSSKTYSTLLTSKATSITGSATSANTSVAPGYHHNTYGPRSIPTAAVDSYVSDTRLTASDLTRDGMPTLCVGGLALLAVVLLVSAKLYLQRHRTTRLSSESTVRYNAAEEERPLILSIGEKGSNVAEVRSLVS